MKAYCDLPFIRFRVDFEGGYHSCCHQDEYYGNIFKEGKTIEELFKGPSLREVKVACVNDELHSICNNNRCPHFKADLPKKFEVNPVAQYPKQIEMALSPRMCNIGGKNPTPKTACTMCPRSNAAWMEKYINGTVPDRTDEVLEFIKPALPTLECLTILGIIEPFYQNQIFDVFDKLDFKQYRDQIQVWTFCNATLFGDKVQDRYHEYVKKSIFGFSVDAATPETYKKIRRLNYFHVVKRNLTNYFKKCKEEQRWDESFIANNINMWNVHEVSDMVKFAKEVGAPHIQFVPTHGQDDGYNLPKHYYCNEDNWQIFDEAQEKAIEVGKEIGQSVQFYVPLHRGFKK
jgi:hypothetical protein